MYGDIFLLKLFRNEVKCVYISQYSSFKFKVKVLKYFFNFLAIHISFYSPKLCCGGLWVKSAPSALFLSFQDRLKENLDRVICLNHERTSVSKQFPSELRGRLRFVGCV